MTAPAEDRKEAPKAKPKPKKKAKPRAPRKTTREQRAASINLDDAPALARVDVVIQAIGECVANTTIVRMLVTGIPERNVPGISPSQAYDYLKRGQLELQAELSKNRVQQASEAISRLKTIQRKAVAEGEFAAALAAEDRLALHSNQPNPITAAKAIHVTDTPQPARPAGSLSDEELEAVVALAQKAKP